MELTQLHYFMTVAQTQHLTRAAETLRISQPALSKAISRLEKELGTVLFDRGANRITLNENGRLYLEYVQKSLQLLDSGKEALQSRSGVASGNVSIITSCSGLLQPVIRKFLTEHKDIHYQQYRCASDAIAEQLEGGAADFAVTTTPLSSVKFSWEPLVRDELYAAFSIDHPLSRVSSVTLEELSAQPLIINNSLLSIHDIVMEGMAQHGLRPKIAYELNNPPLLEQLLRENRGVSFVPGLKQEPMPDSQLETRRLVPVEGCPFAYEVGILKLRGHFETSVAELLEQCLRAWFSDPQNRRPET